MIDFIVLLAILKQKEKKKKWAWTKIRQIIIQTTIQEPSTC